MNYDFEKQADYLMQRIVRWASDSPNIDNTEIDWLEDGFYINTKHSVSYSMKKDSEAEQIILSSPISGVSLFNFDPHTSEWHKNDGTLLEIILKNELMIDQLLTA